MSKKKILFADDAEDFLLSIKAFFEDTYDVETAENGVVALDKVMNTNFDLVVLDINMPFMKGNETMKALKSQNPAAIVIAFTAESLPEQVQSYMDQGFNEVVLKPIEMFKLGEIIEKYMKISDLPKEEQSKHLTQTPQKDITETVVQPEVIASDEIISNLETAQAPTQTNIEKVTQANQESPQKTVLGSPKIIPDDLPVEVYQQKISQLMHEKQQLEETIEELKAQIKLLRSELPQHRPTLEENYIEPTISFDETEEPDNDLPTFELE